MKIDEMCTCCFDMSLIWELYILFLESNSEFFIDLCSDSMLIEATEYFSILSLEDEWDTFSIELFLNLKSLHETHMRLILSSFFIGFDLFHAIFCDLSCESFWYEKIPSLRRGDFDDRSFTSDICDRLEEFYGEFVCRHGDILGKNKKSQKETYDNHE